MSLIRKHVAVLQAWACLALVYIVFTVVVEVVDVIDGDPHTQMTSIEAVVLLLSLVVICDMNRMSGQEIQLVWATQSKLVDNFDRFDWRRFSVNHRLLKIDLQLRHSVNRRWPVRYQSSG